jgi:heat shock protein HslJ
LNLFRTPLIFVILLSLLAACANPPAAPTAVPTATELTASTEVVSLTTNAWQWVSFTNPVEQFAIDEPQNYVLTFNEDGTVNIIADCNNASGSYTTDGSSISIQVGPMTMAACPPDSRSDDFIKYLGFAAIYFFKDGNLFIDLFADGGTLEFAPASGG